MDNNVSKDSLGFLSAFNLKTTPFTSSIDTGNLCQSRQFKDTLARLCYAAENRMFAVLTGPVGVGKSTVLRAFNDAMQMMPRSNSMNSCYPLQQLRKNKLL